MSIRGLFLICIGSMALIPIFARELYAQAALTIETQMAPPHWALLERELLRASAEACEEFAARYLDDRGYLECVERWGGNDGPDDAMENFYNWTLLHALGAPESVLALYRKAWESHIRQYTEAKAKTVPIAIDGMFYKEFIKSFDWEHNGEGLAAFLMEGLSDPANLKWQQRIRRFAGFYMNEDPEAPNYDPMHKIIRSLHNGSKGPKLTPATVNEWGGDPEPGDPGRQDRYVTASNIKGDHPLNLCATALPMNAYMVAHEKKYKDWLMEYIEAWRERVVSNNGNVPTNIGLDGTIGGEWDGKWYGGVFGWNFWPETASRNYFPRGPRMAFGIAFMLTGGDQRYVDVLRMQMDNLYNAAKTIDGMMMLPYKYGDNGWYGYTRERHFDILRDLYCWTLQKSDVAKLSDDGWIKFLQGNDPRYPEEALQREFAQLRRKIQGMRQDTTTADTRGSDYSQRFNPAMTVALVNLMLGGNDPGSIGNILHSQVRFFDPVARRAGLPPDVGSLVDRIEPGIVRLTLVNLHQLEEREVIVQTGAYGEHQCLSVESGDAAAQINNRFFTVKLEAGAGGTIEIHLRRYVNQPTLALPWQGEGRD